MANGSQAAAGRGTDQELVMSIFGWFREVLRELKRSNELQERTNELLEILVKSLTTHDLKEHEGEVR